VLEKGSEFHFTIETDTFAERPATYSDNVHANLRERRILVVNGQKTNREILRLNVEHWGMIAHEVCLGEEALALLQQTTEEFDIICLDIQLPDMEGMDLAQQIAQIPRYSNVPIVMLAARSQHDVQKQRQIADLKQATVIYKPIKPSQLHNVLAQYLDSLGYTADVANNGCEAVSAVHQQNYDLIFMDVQMPEMDGIEATREIIRTVDEKIRPRIVAMTAGGTNDDRGRITEAGMEGLVLKPVQIPEVVEVLQSSWHYMQA